MIPHAKRTFATFRADAPGSRFKERYRRRQRDDASRWRSPLYITVGALLAVVSLFLGWAPGPGILTFFVGLWLVAGELYPAAQLMDWSEVRARNVYRAFADFFAGASRSQRLAATLGLAALAILVVLGLVKLLTGL